MENGMTARNFVWILVALVAASLIGCSSGKKGRIMGEGEQDYVGKDAAGSATYDRLIEDSVTKLLRRQSAAKTGLSQLKVAYLGVENKSAEDLGDFQDQLFQLIDTSINKADRFRTISSRYVNAALKETRLRRDQLFIPKHRREFIKTLETQGNPVEFLLFSTITSGTTRGEDVKQRAYALTMELVDVETGYNDKETARIRKAYTR